MRGYMSEGKCQGGTCQGGYVLEPCCLQQIILLFVFLALTESPFLHSL